MIYFTADPHFGHEKIIRHTGRPFLNAAEMDEALIRNWNRTIRPKDEIFVVGDFTMKGPDYAAGILTRLNGRKYLIRGNHDQFVDRSELCRSMFEWVKDYAEISWQNQKFVLFHYPIGEWNGYYRGTIHVHGHQHNHEEYNLENLAKGIRRYDVGVDANGMKPVSIAGVAEFFSGISW